LSEALPLVAFKWRIFNAGIFGNVQDFCLKAGQLYSNLQHVY